MLIKLCRKSINTRSFSNRINMRESDFLLLSKERKGVKMDWYIWGRIFPYGMLEVSYTQPPIEKNGLQISSGELFTGQ